jgi:peptide/nickel transport system permease protein
MTAKPEPAPGSDRVAWSGPVSRQAFLRWRTPLFGVALAVLGAAGTADQFGLLGLDVRPLYWLYSASLLVVAAYVAAPLAANRTLAARYWSALADNNLAVASLVYVVGFFVVGTVGPLLVGAPSETLAHGYQPPAFTTVHTVVVPECLGPVVDSTCRGTLQYPLGTTARGQDMVRLLVAGARVAAAVALVASTLAVPIGIGVGLLAGYRGGVLDDALMRYVDIQGAVPAFLVYFVVATVYGRSLLLLVLVFGLLNWGNVARLVRGETKQVRTASYVDAAATAGAGPLYTIRRVLLPNVASAAVTSVTREAATLVLIEAALAFMSLSELHIGSWGETIAFGLDGLFFPDTWWISLFPTLALALTVVAFTVLGDALRDVLDPEVG